MLNVLEIQIRLDVHGQSNERDFLCFLKHVCNQRLSDGGGPMRRDGIRYSTQLKTMYRRCHAKG